MKDAAKLIKESRVRLGEIKNEFEEVRKDLEADLGTMIRDDGEYDEDDQE